MWAITFALLCGWKKKNKSVAGLVFFFFCWDVSWCGCWLFQDASAAGEIFRSLGVWAPQIFEKRNNKFLVSKMGMGWMGSSYKVRAGDVWIFNFASEVAKPTSWMWVLLCRIMPKQLKQWGSSLLESLGRMEILVDGPDGWLFVDCYPTGKLMVLDQ